MKPIVEEFNQLLRWLQADIGGGRPGLGTNQRGQASSLQCAECVFVSLVIAQVGDSGVWFRFRQNGADGITFIAARNPDLQAAIEFKQRKWIFRNQWQPEVADFGLDLHHFARRQPSPMNGNASRLYFSLRIELDGLKKLGGKQEYTSRSGPELVQKSRVRDLTLECLHAGS